MNFRLKMLPPSSGCDTSYGTSAPTYKSTRSQSQNDRNLYFLAARSLKKPISSNKFHATSFPLHKTGCFKLISSVCTPYIQCSLHFLSMTAVARCSYSKYLNRTLEMLYQRAKIGKPAHQMGRECQDTALGLIQLLFLQLAGVTPELCEFVNQIVTVQSAPSAPTVLPRHLPRYEELRDLTIRLNAITQRYCGGRIFKKSESFMYEDNFSLNRVHR